MTIEKMAEELNKFCNDTLSITHFVYWTVTSYGEGTFWESEPFGERIRAKTFKKAIVMAYAKMQKAKEKNNGK